MNRDAALGVHDSRRTCFAPERRTRSKLTEWKQYVRTWASLHWGIGPPTKVAVELSVTYFHEGDTILLDNDNMLKPIQDALNGLVYEDDRLVTLVHVKKDRIRRSFSLQGCSKLVLDGLFEGKPFIAHPSGQSTEPRVLTKVKR